ncbi:5-methyltetrahydropteroyltriglutamate--homocysteine S-methyltransferase [Fodinicola acaciae]|uniref:5-methyltetrahydropteroyltriglutamate-- homocysteine S-methyltransferase n=1 Tax=Fodinicola acaciae TaxID=2681555 RepID=UPI0013D6183E|nr:5-methyltetrahydropteroyltriglutamate--homocysteine S-methyltransferase [Fodinicola acaciae]
MKRTTPPFRADHVGSLLRPQRLLKARDDVAAGTLPAGELRAIEDDCIREVVRMQRDVGLQSATDGEFRRGSWHMDFIYQLGGVTKVTENIKVQFRNESGTIEFTPSGIHVDAPITLDKTIFGEDFSFLKSIVETTPKQTIPSPSMVHYRGGRASIDEKVYPDLEQFWTDLSAAYAQEIRGLADLGATYVQLDDTSLAYLNDPKQREQITAMGADGEHQHLRNIKQINEALKDRPDGVTITTHLCRGNFRSSWVAEGGYDYVAEALFGDLAVDGFFLEFDDARSGSFAPLRYVPPDKMVVLGLVTTKRPQLEDKDDLKRRIEEATRYVDIDQLAISGQCGFSSTVDGNALTYDDQVAKLSLIVETAAEVWG